MLKTLNISTVFQSPDSRTRNPERREDRVPAEDLRMAELQREVLAQEEVLGKEEVLTKGEVLAREQELFLRLSVALGETLEAVWSMATEER